MNFDKLISIAASVVIGAAAVGRLDALQKWIWIAQAKVAYESRSSHWGSPKFFNRTIERRSSARVSSRKIIESSPKKQ